MPDGRNGDKTQKQDLSVFGRWLDTLCSIFKISEYRVGERANIRRSRLTKASQGEVRLGADALLAISQVFEEESERQGIPLLIRRPFLNSCGISTPDQQRNGEEFLKMLEVGAELRIVLKQQQEIIERQEAEIQDLRKVILLEQEGRA